MFRPCIKYFRLSSVCSCGRFRFSKDVKYGHDVRTAMLQGIDALANAVAITLGPKTRTAIIDHAIDSPVLAKNGVSVAQAIELRNRLQDIGTKLVRELAYKTNEVCEDGTNMATILARAIAKGGFEKISEGSSPTDIRRGVMIAINEVKRCLKTLSHSVNKPEEIRQVASVYANGDKAVSDLVCEAINMVSRDAVIAIMKGKGRNHEMEIVEGMKLDSGYISPYFINTPNDESVELQNALLLLTDTSVSSMNTIMPAIDLVSLKRTPLLIIADDISGEALKSLVLGRLKTGLRVAAIRAPGFGENKKAILNDIAIATGGAVLGDGDIENVKLSDFGKVGNVVISKEDTLLLNGMGKRDGITKRVDQIKDQMAEATTLLGKRQLRERLANLVHGVVLIHVGGASELQINEKMERLKATLYATRAAIEEGIVPGGGISLLKCIPGLDSVQSCNQTQRMGIDIVRRALRMPCITIATKAGVDAGIIAAHIENQNDDYGFEPSGGNFKSLVEMGIIDPTKVIRTALADAAGVASLLMTAETVIADISKDKA